MAGKNAKKNGRINREEMFNLKFCDEYSKWKIVPNLKVRFRRKKCFNFNVWV